MARSSPAMIPEVSSRTRPASDNPVVGLQDAPSGPASSSKAPLFQRQKSSRTPKTARLHLLAHRSRMVAIGNASL